MARDFRELPGVMTTVSRRIESNTQNLVKRVAIEVGDVLVENTRVDTGLARSNWQGTLDVPAAGTIPPYAPGRRLGLAETANANAAKSQLRATTARFDLDRNRTIFITNNVPYIGLLNDGSVAETPQNFVEKAVQRGRDVVKRQQSLTQRRRR
jgi:hypothetical protein